jgi:hypothetical protein
MLLLYFSLPGWSIGLIIGIIVLSIGFTVVAIICKLKKTGESRGTIVGVAPVEPNVYRE